MRNMIPKLKRSKKNKNCHSDKNESKSSIKEILHEKHTESNCKVEKKLDNAQSEKSIKFVNKVN